ncbi:MAG: HAMP domain-containing methyl-accepting chemotaxis protein [Rhodopila sp.]|jgi:methyl-accepting chemotaxis protein
MSSAAIAAVTPVIQNISPPLRRSFGLSVGGRIYALCLGLILITVGVATLGYLGLSGQGQSLKQYIRVSEATKAAVNVGYEFTRVRRHVAIFAENESDEEIKFLNDHNKMAMDAIAAADERIVVEDRKIMIQDIAEQFRGFAKATAELIALRKDLDQAATAFQESFAGLGAPRDNETAEASALRSAVQVLRFRGTLLTVSMAPAVYKGFQDWQPTVTAAMRADDGSEATLHLKAAAQTVLDRGTRLAEANDRLRQSISGNLAVIATKIEGSLAVFITRQEKFAADLAEAAADASVATQMRMLIASVAGALIGLVICFVVARGITRPLKAMTGAMERLSAGDASITVSGRERSDEIGAMARALDVFRQNADKIVAMMSAEAVTLEIGETITAASENDLTVRVDLSNKTGFLRNIGAAINTLLEGSNATLRDINLTTRHVATAVSEASVAVGQVSSGARAQNAAVGQVTQALTESAKAIRMVSTSANAASEKGVMAAQLVERGQVSAEQLARIVETIAQNSRKISQITQVIAGIANRTHILSLNAAIEAARAGEHGKGFVVVAQEVGKLAESAAQNAQQITDIVEQATADAAEGRTASLAVKQTMDSIAGDVSQTSQMIRSIAVAMEEQQAMVTQIEGNVGDLRGIAAGNAVAAEEITATMIQLSQLADEQRQKLSTFKTN